MEFLTEEIREELQQLWPDNEFLNKLLAANNLYAIGRFIGKKSEERVDPRWIVDNEGNPEVVFEEAKRLLRIRELNDRYCEFLFGDMNEVVSS